MTPDLQAASARRHSEKTQNFRGTVLDWLVGGRNDSAGDWASIECRGRSVFQTCYVPRPQRPHGTGRKLPNYELEPVDQSGAGEVRWQTANRAGTRLTAPPRYCEATPSRRQPEKNDQSQRVPVRSFDGRKRFYGRIHDAFEHPREEGGLESSRKQPERRGEKSAQNRGRFHWQNSRTLKAPLQRVITKERRISKYPGSIGPSNAQIRILRRFGVVSSQSRQDRGLAPSRIQSESHRRRRIAVGVN